MTLSPIEKHLLINQCEILKRLDPDQEKDYDLLLSALYNGYDDDLEELLPQISKPISGEVMQEVRDILEMFRSLGPNDGGKTPATAHFVGFDGNDESEYHAYASFLLEERGKWAESRNDGDDYNTHHETLSKYRAMLTELRASKDRYNLTGDDVRRIIAKAPRESINAG